MKMALRRRAGVISVAAAVVRRRGVGSFATVLKRFGARGAAPAKLKRFGAGGVIALMAAALLGCSGGISGLTGNPIKGNAIIDWVDFVKHGGHSYTGLWEAVLQNPDDVTGEAAGKVKFKVGDVVTNPSYRTKDGDAAFLAIGTELLRVRGFAEDELLAVRDTSLIGGYRLYAEDGFAKTVRMNYADIPKARVTKVELYREGNAEPYRTLEGSDKERFIALLDGGQDKRDYRPASQRGDPEYRRMVFYADGPLAYQYTIADDGDNVFFSPWETRLVDAEVRELLRG